MGVMMSKLVKTKNWMPINDFLKKAGVTRKQMYNYISSRKWYDGVIVKKPKNGRKYVVGCYDDYLEWLGS